MFYQADAYGRSGWAGVRRALAMHGETIAGEATYRRGTRFTGSLRAQVEILQAAKPEAVICIGAYAACAAFARDAVDLGLHVPIANLSFVGSENLLKLLADLDADSTRYTSVLVNSQVVPSYEDVSIPAVLEYRELMARYDPEPPAELLKESYAPFAHSFVSLEGFLDAKLLVEVLRRLGDPPDRHDLERAVYSVRDYDLGIGEPVSFGPDRRQGLQKVYYTVVEDGRFVTLGDWRASSRDRASTHRTGVPDHAPGAHRLHDPADRVAVLAAMRARSLPGVSRRAREETGSQEHDAPGRRWHGVATRTRRPTHPLRRRSKAIS